MPIGYWFWWVVCRHICIFMNEWMTKILTRNVIWYSTDRMLCVDFYRKQYHKLFPNLFFKTMTFCQIYLDFWPSHWPHFSHDRETTGDESKIYLRMKWKFSALDRAITRRNWFSYSWEILISVTVTVKKVRFFRKNVSFSFISIKHVSVTFFLRASLIRTLWLPLNLIFLVRWWSLWFLWLSYLRLPGMASIFFFWYF